MTVLSYTPQADALYRQWRHQRIRVGTHDLRIGAICVAHVATLISRNRRDFGQVPGLRVEFWGIHLRRDTWVSVRYAEALNSTKSSVNLQSTDRHDILGQKRPDFQVSL